VSGYSVVDRVRISLTNAFLLSFTSWPFTTVWRTSETIARVFVALRSNSEVTMARTSRRMSETVPCVLASKGADDSPGALDTEVRCQFHFQPRSLTWREARQGSVVTR